MTNIKAAISGAYITARVSGPLTCGMVGVPVTFEFDATWDNLTKTAVFRAGNKTIVRVDIQTETTVPSEVLEKQNCALFLGVYGADQQGTLVIPTIWAETSIIQPGADPSGDESTAPSLPVWQQLINKNNEQDRLLDALMKRPTAKEEIFVATYGETTFAQLEAEKAAGKLLYCNRFGRLFPMTDYRPQEDMYFSFTDANAMYMKLCTVENVWREQTVNIPGAHAASHGKDGTDPIAPIFEQVQIVMQDEQTGEEHGAVIEPEGYTQRGAAVLVFNGVRDDGPTILRNIAHPDSGYDAANKEYVDNLVGGVETALDSIIAIQNSLIGGEGV